MLGLLHLPSGWVGYVSLLLAALGSIGLGSMLKAWLDHKYRSRKQSDDMANVIVTLTNQRLALVERHARLCDANLAFVRHRQNNDRGNFDALLLLIEFAPDRTKEIIARIKERRSEQIAAEGEERAALLAAALQPDALPEDPGEAAEPVEEPKP